MQPIAKALHILLLGALVVWLTSSLFLMITVGDPEFGRATDHLFAAWMALIVQPLYPILHILSSKLPWTRAWRVVRAIHLSLVLLVLIGFGILVLTTPDVSGFKS